MGSSGVPRKRAQLKGIGVRYELRKIWSVFLEVMCIWGRGDTVCRLVRQSVQQAEELTVINILKDMMVFKFKLLNSFLFRINNSLPCLDLNPGPHV